MKKPDRREFERDKDDAEKRRQEMRRIEQELSKLSDDAERAALKSKIQRRDIIYGSEAGSGSFGRAGVPKAKPRAQEQIPIGFFNSLRESLTKANLDEIMSKREYDFLDRAKIKRRLEGSPSAFKWLFRDLDNFNKERLVDEFKELEGKKDKTDERLYLEIKKDVFGLSKPEEKRLSYIEKNPGKGLLEFEKTRHAILQDQVARTVGSAARNAEWMPSQIYYDEWSARIKRIVKLLRLGEDTIPDSKKDETRDDAIKILQHAVREKGVGDAARRDARTLLERYNKSSSSVTLREQRGPLKEYFTVSAGPGSVEPVSESEGPVPTSQYMIITNWDLADANARTAARFHYDNYLLRIQAAMIGKYLPKASKLWWARKKIKGKIEYLFDDIDEEKSYIKVFERKVGEYRKGIEQREEELVTYERFTTEEQTQMKKIFEAEIKKLQEYELAQEAAVA